MAGSVIYVALLLKNSVNFNFSMVILSVVVIANVSSCVVSKCKL